jgi:hypothetical protein
MSAAATHEANRSYRDVLRNRHERPRLEPVLPVKGGCVVLWWHGWSW